MKRLLVPCDFSDTAQEAFQFAVKLTQKSKGEIHVLFVLDLTFLKGNPTLSHNYAFNVNFLKQMEEESNANFQKMWQRYSPRTISVKFSHRIGSLAPDVESYIRENDIDLVIMGTHGTDGSRWGSNAEKIVRESSVPVFSVRKNPDKEIRNIVLPLVPEHHNKDFADRVKTMQAFFDAKLHLLWINTPGSFKSDPEATLELSQYARTFAMNNITLNIRTEQAPTEGILRFARETHMDVIAIGTHARKGLNHLFVGSVAEEIVNHGSCPIWTYALNPRELPQRKAVEKMKWAGRPEDGSLNPLL